MIVKDKLEINEEGYDEEDAVVNERNSQILVEQLDFYKQKLKS